MQSIISYYFAEEWNFDEKTLGVLLMCANVFSGISALAATPLVAKFGAINTMVRRFHASAISFASSSYSCV